MKVPSKVLDIVVRLPNNSPVSTEERGTVLLWAKEGLGKRETARIEAARQLLASVGS